jgi:hypothetical protein
VRGPFRRAQTRGNASSPSIARILPARGRGENANSFSRRIVRVRVLRKTERRSGLCEAIDRRPLKGGLPAPKREAERRKAHCPTNVRAKRGSAPLSLPSSAACRRGTGRGHAAFRRSSLRHSPPASTPMAQPRNRVSRGRGWRVLPASPNEAAVKHAPCRPVLVPVDRGSRAARVRLASRPRAPRLALVFTALPSGKAPSNERDDAV